MEDIEGKIIDLVRTNKLSQAIDVLYFYAKERDNDTCEEVILLDMRLCILEKASNCNAVSWDDEKRERVSIAKSILRVRGRLLNDLTLS